MDKKWSLGQKKQDEKVAQANIDIINAVHMALWSSRSICLGDRSACLGGVLFYSVLFSFFLCVWISADAAVYILTLGDLCVSCFVGGGGGGLISYMLYVQQQYFLHAHSSKPVDVLAVASLGSLSATAAAA